MSFSLRFDKNQIKDLANRYDYSNDDPAVEEIALRVRHRGHYTKKDFLAVCRWKSPRSQSRCSENSEELIKAVTKIALSNPPEELRIGVLRFLRGVDWPTASVLLHFGHYNLYPILDYRALWSLNVRNIKPYQYDFEFWWSYTLHCRRLAKKCNVTMRLLDKALWQYSKECQH